MAAKKRKGGSKQSKSLSKEAQKRKAERDLAIAKTPRRRKMKAENQRKRRAAKRAGKNIDGKDYNHKTGRFDSVKNNRGNFGKGTKKENKSKY